MQAQPTPIRPFQKSPLAIFRLRHLYALGKALTIAKYQPPKEIWDVAKL
jgi:hypothetical protein